MYISIVQEMRLITTYLWEMERLCLHTSAQCVPANDEISKPIHDFFFKLTVFSYLYFIHLYFFYFSNRLSYNTLYGNSS